MSQLANTAISTVCGKDKVQRKEIRDHFPDIGKMISFYRTTAEKHSHISCYASAHQLLCGRRHLHFRQLLLYLPATSIIYLKDFCYTFQVLFLYLSMTIPISFDDFPYIPQRSPLYLPASASVSAFHLFFQHQFSLIYDF